MREDETTFGRQSSCIQHSRYKQTNNIWVEFMNKNVHLSHCASRSETKMETLTQYRSRYYHQLISYNLFLPCAQATATRIYVQMEWTDSENTSFFGHVRQPAAATFRSQPKTWIRNLLIKIPFCSKIVTELFSSFQQFKAEIIEQKNKTIELHIGTY